MKSFCTISLLLLAFFAGCSSDKTSDGAGGNDGLGGNGGSGAANGTGGNSSVCDSPDDASPVCRERYLKECVKRTIENCEELPFCDVVSGRKIDADAECVSPKSEDLSCGVMGCGALMTNAEAPDGTLWRFPSTCIPEDFVERPSLIDEDCGEGGAGGFGGNP
jgi:hypothetical protein